MYTFYWIDATYACGGLLVEPGTGRIVATAPIFNSFRGRNVDTIIARLRRRGWLRLAQQIRNG